MSHVTVVEVSSAVCPWLATVLCVLRIVKWSHLPLRRWALLASGSAIGAVVMIVPVQGLPIARWIAGVNANFSIPLTGVLAVMILERVFERSLFSESEWKTTWGFGAIAGLALYPMALGLGSADPYVWGWQFSPLFVVIGVSTAWLVWKQNRFGLLLLAAIVAFQLRLLESANYWDYLIDPVYSLVSIGWLAVRFAASTRSSLTKRYSKTLPPNISTI